MLHLESRDLGPVNYGFWRPLLRQLDEMFDGVQHPPGRSQWEANQADFSPPFDLDETDDH